MTAEGSRPGRLRIGPWLGLPASDRAKASSRAKSPDGTKPADRAKSQHAKPPAAAARGSAPTVILSAILHAPPRIPAYRRHRWFAVAAMAVALGIVVASTAVAVSLTSGFRPDTGPGGGDLPAVAAPPAPVPAPLAVGDSPSPSPTTTRSSKPPKRVPSRSPSPATPTSAAAGSVRAAAPLVPTGGVTYEAEAPGNTLGGSAWVDSYPGASGGMIVRNLGDWGIRGGPGWLRFNSVTVPATGRYTVTLYAIHLNNEPSRTVLLTVSGASPVSALVSASATCCAASGVVVMLVAGTNSITIGNPDGHGPSIDQIVISPA